MYDIELQWGDPSKTKAKRKKSMASIARRLVKNDDCDFNNRKRLER